MTEIKLELQCSQEERSLAEWYINFLVDKIQKDAEGLKLEWINVRPEIVLAIVSIGAFFISAKNPVSKPLIDSAAQQLVAESERLERGDVND